MANETPNVVDNLASPDAAAQAAIDPNTGLSVGQVSPQVAPAQAAPAPAPAAPAAAPAAPVAAGEPDTYADHFGQSIAKLADHPAAAAALSSFSGMSKALIGASLDAIAAKSGASDANRPLDKAAAAQGLVRNIFAPLAGNVGGVGGLGDTAKAANEQAAAQRQAERTQENEKRRLDMEEQRNQIQFVQANLQNLHTQQLLHANGDKAMDEGIANDSRMYQTLKDVGAEGTEIRTGLTSSQANAMIGKEWDPRTTFRLLTGKKNTGTIGEDGLPVYEPTYTLVHVPERVNLTDPKQIHELFPDVSEEALKGVDADHPWAVSGADLIAAHQDAANAKAIKDSIDAAAADAKIKGLEQGIKLEGLTFKEKGVLAHTLADVSRLHPEKDAAERMITAAEELMLNPPKEFPNLMEDLKGVMGDKLFDKLMEHQLKQDALEGDNMWQGDKVRNWIAKPAEAIAVAEGIEKKYPPNSPEYKQAQEIIAMSLRANEATREEKKAEAKAQEEGKQEVAAFDTESDKTNLTGQDYLNSLPEDKRTALQAVAEGREIRSPRQLQDKNGNLTPFALALHRGYPDFDIQKAIHYGDAVKEFQSTKPNTAGWSLNAGSAALGHLKRLDELAAEHWIQIHNPQSDAGRRYNKLLDTVAGELLSFYGVPKTNETMAKQKEDMAGFLNRRSAISEQARSMGVKWEAFEQQWNNAAPRESFRPPLPGVDDDAKDAMAYFDPEFAKAHPQLFSKQKPTLTKTGSVAPAAPKPTAAPVATPTAPAAPAHLPANKVTGYKIGDKFNAGGFEWTVTALNPDGSVKDAK